MREYKRIFNDDNAGEEKVEIKAKKVVNNSSAYEDNFDPNSESIEFSAIDNNSKNGSDIYGYYDIPAGEDRNSTEYVPSFTQEDIKGKSTSKKAEHAEEYQAEENEVPGEMDDIRFNDIANSESTVDALSEIDRKEQKAKKAASRRRRVIDDNEISITAKDDEVVKEEKEKENAIHLLSELDKANKSDAAEEETYDSMPQYYDDIQSDDYEDDAIVFYDIDNTSGSYAAGAYYDEPNEEMTDINNEGSYYEEDAGYEPYSEDEDFEEPFEDETDMGSEIYPLDDEEEYDDGIYEEPAADDYYPDDLSLDDEDEDIDFEDVGESYEDESFEEPEEPVEFFEDDIEDSEYDREEPEELFEDDEEQITEPEVPADEDDLDLELEDVPVSEEGDTVILSKPVHENIDNAADETDDEVDEDLIDNLDLANDNSERESFSTVGSEDDFEDEYESSESSGRGKRNAVILVIVCIIAAALGIGLYLAINYFKSSDYQSAANELTEEITIEDYDLDI